MAGTHVGEGHGVARITKVIEHVLDEDGALGSAAVCMESVGGLRVSMAHLTNTDVDAIGTGESNGAHSEIGAPGMVVYVAVVVSVVG